MKGLISLMLLAGTGMFFGSGGSISGYILVLQDMMNILVVSMVLELIGLPAALRDLRPLFRPLLKNTKKPAALFSQLSIVCMLLGSIINMAAITLIYYSIWESLRERSLAAVRPLGVSLKRGMAFSLFWSPFGVIMALIIEYSGVPWTSIAPITFLMSLVALMISFFSEHLVNKRESLVVGKLLADDDLGSLYWPTFKNLATYVMILIASVVFLNTYTVLGMIDTLIVISVIMPLAWAALTGILPLYIDRTGHYFRCRVPDYGQPFSLFITAGVFAGGLRSFGFESVIDNLLAYSFDALGLIGVIMIIVSVIMFLSWVGIHQAVTLVLIGQNLNFQGGLIPPHYYAIAMIVGGAMSNLTSPISSTTLISAGLLKRSPLEVGILWNALFVAVFFCALPLILFLLITLIS